MDLAITAHDVRKCKLRARELRILEVEHGDLSLIQNERERKKEGTG